MVATYVENFENVEAKQRIVRILDTSRIEFVTNVPESIIAFAPYARRRTLLLAAKSRLRELGFGGQWTRAEESALKDICASAGIKL